ncbi:hypothetical protein Kpol_480p26 [Vanderwaltozyma polyspora DSM 70294]|uniref:Glucose N-acetyltransferase 1 n=1 Tax=Vanderwaltozyma polyspora (strain ATCC 22028 / DSM 70294 / BCRC 21397 / CBS 2163 / NBRC 10782 / NRRL Y-8283 / UCD 57-17) TaxID=436907 RepID=A7TP88_VANPO|nr:uncharacterized protein Kpol_480p26 [Vanderwaltozyma polyspora DSM 70294]EDO15939.1 hypothetical protein Kpol_480p26 [Vanderwaltozyma polyspora DSM 70294]
MIFKRRLRILLIALAFIVSITVIVRCIVHFQLSKEITYYKNYFEKRKDGIQGLFNPLVIKQIPQETIDSIYKKQLQKKTSEKNAVDWDKLAYVNYVTHASYLCNSLVMFNSLKKYGTKAKLVLLLSKDILEQDSEDGTKHSNKLVKRIQNIDKDQVIVKLVDNIVKPKDYTPWNQSLTKLLVFNQTEFDRIVYLDNDALLKNSLDELFFIPQYIKFAAPLTYWFLSENEVNDAFRELKYHEKIPTNLNVYIKKLDERIEKGQMIYNHLPSLPSSLFLNTKNVAQEIISSTSSASPLFDFTNIGKTSKLKFASNLMVINPSKETFDHIMNEALPKILNKKEKYDMDLINEDLYNLKKQVSKQFTLYRRLTTAFKPEVLVLPFSRYGLLTGSLKNQKQYSIIEDDMLGYKRIKEDGEPLEKELTEIVEDAKYIHYSDYPLGKPWNYKSINEIKCVANKKSKTFEQETKVCDLWNSIYEEFMNDASICN